MFDIIINNEIETYGLISYNMRYENGVLYKEGLLKTHLYIEELNEVECSRFKLLGIEIHTETTGSNDKFYIYGFTFESVMILDDGTEYGAEELLEIYKKEGN